MSKHFLLFLGAGASQPFGIPTMQEMVEKFEEEIKIEEFNEASLYTRIKKTQEEAYDSSHVDIESIFSVIQGIANGIKRKDMGHLPFYYISQHYLKDEFSEHDIEIAKNLQNKLKKFIKKECNSSLSTKEKNEAYSNSYHALFSNLTSEKQNFSDEHSYSQFWRAYTTNYDTIFEDFWFDFFKLSDYFKQDGNSQHQIFDVNSSPTDILSLMKLHGSLDWVKEKSGKILKIAKTSFTRLQLEGEVMVFPIQQKDLYLHPWLTLFQDLKKYLNAWNKWIVIGYAFNDEFIFEIFKESFNENKSLLLINPKGEEIKNKFPENMQEKIIVLPIKFGDEYFPQHISDYFSNTKTITIKLKTTCTAFAFHSNFALKHMMIFNETKQESLGNVSGNSNKIIFNKEFPHDNDDEFICALTFENQPPFDKMFMLSMFAGNEFNYSMEVYYEDRFLTSEQGTSELQEDDKMHYSNSIMFDTSQLFVR